MSCVVCIQGSQQQRYVHFQNQETEAHVSLPVFLNLVQILLLICIQTKTLVFALRCKTPHHFVLLQYRVKAALDVTCKQSQPGHFHAKVAALLYLM